MMNDMHLSQLDINETQLLRGSKELLNNLLKDYTTGENIKWGTDSYINHGIHFRDDQEIKADLITGWYDGFIRPRAVKNKEIQLDRQRNKAEVFTPSWIVKLQVDAALEDIENLPLEEFINTKWLEITCGEAPYMVNRYDMTTGKVIALNKRAGFIDVKFKRLNQEVKEENQWVKFAFEIYKASYGYEYQGDSLLLARENLMLTFLDNYFLMFGAFPESELILEVSEIVSLNVFQMDGITYEVPYSNGGKKEFGVQLNLFDEYIEENNDEPQYAKIKFWENNDVIYFKDIVERNAKGMKFDVVIGNPPYQKQVDDDNKEFSPAIYHWFINASQRISKKAILIHPARFLFNAGSTPKSWNESMLNNPHFKVLHYEQNSDDIFSDTDIKGGVAITYYDSEKRIGPILTFTPYSELRTIMEKIKMDTVGLTDIIYTQNRFNLEQLYTDYPNFKNVIGSKGKDKRFRNNIFDKISIFSKNRNSNSDVAIIGLIDNKRVWRHIEQKYVDLNHANLNKYKVLVPRANGTGRLGETLSSPFIAVPNEGYTQTFIGIGAFDTEVEANAALKYIKTKFARAMLAILKITQDNDREKWGKVPFQDFTINSDIDWSKSIPEIDQQLYTKYDLSQEEIDFIETNVKEME